MAVELAAVVLAEPADSRQALQVALVEPTARELQEALELQEAVVVAEAVPQTGTLDRTALQEAREEFTVDSLSMAVLLAVATALADFLPVPVERSRLLAQLKITGAAAVAEAAVALLSTAHRELLAALVAEDLWAEAAVALGRRPRHPA